MAAAQHAPLNYRETVALANAIDDLAIAPAVAELQQQLDVAHATGTRFATQLADANRRVAERDKRIAELEDALKSAVWAADYLSEQQAMPDYGYSKRLEQARAILAKHGGSHE